MVRAWLMAGALAAVLGAPDVVTAQSQAQGDATATGGFAIGRLPGRVGIDGRAWMFVYPYTGDTRTVRPDGADYDLRFSEPEQSGGVQRWTVVMDRAGQSTPVTSNAKTAFAYVTPDARFIFVEPFTVLDTRTGRRYALDAAFTVKPHVKIVAISGDRRKLFLERSSCVGECATRSDEEYWELTLPQ